MTRNEAVKVGLSMTIADQVPDGIPFDGGVHHPAVWSGQSAGDGALMMAWDEYNEECDAEKS